MERPDDIEDDSSDGDSYWSEDESVLENKQVYNYVEEITNILSETQDVSIENALELNQLMQMRLLRLRGMLDTILQKCRQTYAQNSEKLQCSMKRTLRVMPSYRSCGAPFFRDGDNFAAPLNEDYIYRAEQKGEMFPIDLQLNPYRYWTSGDKRALVRAIKSQVLDYLEPRYEADNRAQRKMLQTTRKNIDLNTISLATLLQRVSKKFEINWNQLSEDFFKGRHSPKNCSVMWHCYMKPELNRGKWTDDENENLMSVAKKYNFQDWVKISQEVPRRSEYQCFLQFQNTVRIKLQSNRKWTPFEDQQLLKAVAANTFGKTINWNKVASYFHNRSKKQIYTRYTYCVDPNVTKGQFTREEDCILFAAMEEYGENFNCIPMSLFPNRTRVQVKNRYKLALKYNGKQRSWTVEDDEKVLEFVKENGTTKWSELATILNGHTRTSCRTRYTTIKKFLTKNPQATIKDFPRKNRTHVRGITASNWVDTIYELKTKGDVYGDALAKRREKINERKNRSTSYRDGLRNLGRHFYDLFKFSYDFSFGKEITINFPIVMNLKYLYNCLHFNMANKMLYRCRIFFTIEEYAFLKEASKRKKKDDQAIETVSRSASTVPPNWSTLLGLRAIAILVNSDEYAENVMNNTIVKRKPTKAESNFNERFIKIFYQAALLSKLDSNIINNNKYVVKYLPPENQVETKPSKRKRTQPADDKKKVNQKKSRR